ncbi:hypothetical protein [Micromonospora sp. WMMD980]|uniref:hypothetical protein n=1 Tax=Micromonospora sp. WMMD980 TaxID=3016088 RepID=UPI0024173B22|nr:hypothetical protein [Micromonospora sp. WMMD980]MDG4801502.1 hypothetical protein [Micromonospora sp. WMMD980]
MSTPRLRRRQASPVRARLASATGAPATGARALGATAVGALALGAFAFALGAARRPGMSQLAALVG